MKLKINDILDNLLINKRPELINWIEEKMNFNKIKAFIDDDGAIRVK